MLDNYGLWSAHDNYLESCLERLPKCHNCGEPIQQEYAVRIDHKWYCDKCIEDFKECID